LKLIQENIDLIKESM